MKLQDMKRIVNKIEKTALRASLYGAGEPLVNKDIYSIIKCASDANISTAISTNLNLFKTSDLSRLLESKLTVLQACLDGFTQDTYGKYRIGGNVEVVKANISSIAEYKRHKNSKFPLIDIQVILFNHIRQELDKIQTFCDEVGVNKITYVRERYGFQERQHKVTGFKTRTCFWLYLGMRIDPDGEILPCCNENPHKLYYGNIYKNSLSDIWNNKYYRFSRALFKNGPNLQYDSTMEKIPCLVCKVYQPQRSMESKS